METGVTKATVLQIETIGEIVNRNKPVIVEKVERMLAAMSAVKVIQSEDDDKYANDVLVKCNATLPVIEGLRKEYTSVIDAWKTQEMTLENQVKDEIDRIRKERTRWKTEQDAEAKRKYAEIEKKKTHDLEIEKVKANLVAGMELAVAERIAQGDAAISKMFSELTLETVDQIEGKLNFEPKLKPELYNETIDGFDKFNGEIVTVEEVADIKARFKAKYTLEVMSEKYVGMVRNVQKQWKEKIPARKKQLQELAKADADTKAKLAASIAQAQLKQQEESGKALAETKAAIEKKREDTTTEAFVNSEFVAQSAKQQVAEADGVRKKIVYRFADEEALINDPMRFVQTMSSIIAHVATDKGYLGIYKRDVKSKLPKKDPTTGLMIYAEEVQGWLDWLATIKPSPTIPGLTATEQLTSVAKK
jgi:hypothetical protein